jgi:hypothetical protein
MGVSGTTEINNDNIQQVPLEAQSHWCFGILNRIARFMDINVQDRLTRNGFERRLGAKRGNQPASVRHE